MKNELLKNFKKREIYQVFHVMDSERRGASMLLCLGTIQGLDQCKDILLDCGYWLRSAKIDEFINYAADKGSVIELFGIVAIEKTIITNSKHS